MTSVTPVCAHFHCCIKFLTISAHSEDVLVTDMLTRGVIIGMQLWFRLRDSSVKERTYFDYVLLCRSCLNTLLWNKVSFSHISVSCSVGIDVVHVLRGSRVPGIIFALCPSGRCVQFQWSRVARRLYWFCLFSLARWRPGHIFYAFMCMQVRVYTK